MSRANEYHPSMLRGLWALTVRELKKWLKEPIILMMAVLQPVIWMGLFGKAMNLNAMFSTNNLNNISIPDAIPIPGNYVIPPVNRVVYVSGAWISQMLQQMFSDVGTSVMQNTFGVTAISATWLWA